MDTVITQQGYSVRRLLFSAFVFFSLLPYLSPVPLPTDIQPIFSLIGFFILALYWRDISLNRFEVVFLIVSLIYLVAFSFIDTQDYFALARKHFNFILVLPAVILFRNFASFISARVLSACIHIYLFAAVLQVAAPSLYQRVVTKLYNYKELELGVRGWSSLMPEPTDFGFTCAMLVVFCLVLREMRQISSMHCKYLVTILTLMCLGTLSGSGLISLVMLAILYYARNIFTFKNVVYLSCVAVGLFFGLESLQEKYRSAYLLYGLLSNPWLIIETTSFFYRVFDNIIAVLYFYDSWGLPAGVGGIYTVGPEIVHKYQLYALFPLRGDFFHFYLNNPPLNIKNGFAQLLVELGWIGLIFIAACYIYISRSQSTLKLLVMLAFTLMMFQSFPVIYPFCWAMISMIHGKKPCKREYQRDHGLPTFS